MAFVVFSLGKFDCGLDCLFFLAECGLDCLSSGYESHEKIWNGHIYFIINFDHM